MRALVLCVLVYAMIPAALCQFPEKLPPSCPLPRDRDAYWAQMAKNASLAAPFPEVVPESAANYLAMRDRIKNTTERFAGERVVYDAPLAALLVQELWVDQGHPNLNMAYQWYVYRLIGDIARWPQERLPDDARATLTMGMLAFVDAGGGSELPTTVWQTARVLDRLAPEDQRVQGRVDRLLEDAVLWAYTVDDPNAREQLERACQKRWGSEAPLRLYALYNAPGPASNELSSGAQRDERYEKVIAELAELLTASPGRSQAAYHKRVRLATEAALRDFSTPEYTDDVTNRLLLVYRMLLARRPEVPEPLADYLESQLHRLAFKGNRLRTDSHWTYWADAVRELGRERISSRFVSFLRSELKHKEKLDPARRSAFESLASLTAIPTSAPDR